MMKYPSVFRRYLATLLDLLVLWFYVYLVTRIPAVIESDGRVGAAVLPVVLTYEPFLTAFRCTIGQWVFRLRVRSTHNMRHISLLQAYVRLLVKYCLGVISVLTIPARQDRRAIHDFATDTVVIEAAQASV
jgi:uncharacterized RDD family membrane protein YckC